ncbi:MAG TPA: DoxX family protein [Longimicrobiales bacterium]|nr:DoxX family protein [Longimicrobiales bacterium]
MALAYHAANAVSIILFLVYGLLCLLSDGMVEEFRRFRLSRFRRPAGVLEVLGAAGLALGYAIPVLTVWSAVGLTSLMLLGVVVCPAREAGQFHGPTSRGELRHAFHHLRVVGLLRPVLCCGSRGALAGAQ